MGVWREEGGLGKVRREGGTGKNGMVGMRGGGGRGEEKTRKMRRAKTDCEMAASPEPELLVGHAPRQQQLAAFGVGVGVGGDGGGVAEG